jgi:hypothetical protein
VSRILFYFKFCILALLLASTEAKAKDCWNDPSTYFSCQGDSSSGVGISAPVLGDTIESNPANLPVEHTPLGLEVLASDRSLTKKSKLNFSTVKGFSGLGVGVGSWSKGTFQAPDFQPHFLGTAYEAEYKEFERKESNVPGFRLGTTFIIPKSLFPRFMRVSLGGSLGLGQVSGEVTPQVGMLVRISKLVLGYSENFEHLSLSLPRSRISVLSGGIFIGRNYFGYSYSTMSSSLKRTHSQNVTMAIPIGKWSAHGGWKFQRDHRGRNDNWYRAGLLRKLSRRFSLGYEYGYYRNSHSALLQIFL